MHRTYTVTLASLGALFALLFGIWLGGHPGKLPGPIRDALVEDDRAIRAELIETIRDDYYKPIDEKKLDDESLKGIVRALDDPYSAYLTPKEARELNEKLNAEFEGIGVSVQPERRGLKVLQVFEGSPARKAGIKKYDVIIGVNGRSIAGVDSDVATSRIKGKAGTKVRLAILPDGAETPRELSVERARIEVPLTEGRMETEDGRKIAYVKLNEFNRGAHGAVRQELEPLLERGAQAVVLDLRGNGGGLLEEAILVASLFVEDGEIVSTKGRSRPEREFEAEGETIADGLPMAVLVDGGSASASEIVTGALRDRGRATVVGEKTFGKGVFQEVVTLSDDSIVELTVGSYYLPKGDNLAENGIKPKVPARDLPRTRRDEALPVAVDLAAASVRR